MEELVLSFLKDTPVILAFFMGVLFSTLINNNRREGMRLTLRSIKAMEQEVLLQCRLWGLNNGISERFGALMLKDLIVALLSTSPVCDLSSALRYAHEKELVIADNLLCEKATQILSKWLSHLNKHTTSTIRRKVSSLFGYESI